MATPNGPYEQGYKAYTEGVSKDDNPYDEYAAPEWVVHELPKWQWLQGWRQAKHEQEMKE